MAGTSNAPKSHNTEEVEDAVFRRELDIIIEYFNHKSMSVPEGYHNE